MSDRTIVTIGCSTDSNYAFLAPLTALFWREVVGFEPFVLFVGDAEEWLDRPSLDVIYKTLTFMDNVRHRFIGRAEGYPDHTMAQNCRQHAGALDFSDDTWLMPADADLWPLRRDFYHQHEGTRFKAVALYANGDHFQGREITLERTQQGLGSQTLPTCHVAMRAKDWRAIYQPIAGDVAGSIKKTLDGWMPTRVEQPGYNMNMHLWMSDQQIMTHALCQQSWFPPGPLPQGFGAHEVGQVLFVTRRGHPPLDRLDRSHAENWEKFDRDRWTDAHVHRGPYTDENWPKLLRIIEAVMPEHMEWAREYREEFAGCLRASQ